MSNRLYFLLTIIALMLSVDRLSAESIGVTLQRYQTDGVVASGRAWAWVGFIPAGKTVMAVDWTLPDGGKVTSTSTGGGLIGYINEKECGKFPDGLVPLTAMEAKFGGGSYQAIIRYTDGTTGTATLNRAAPSYPAFPTAPALSTGSLGTDAILTTAAPTFTFGTSYHTAVLFGPDDGQVDYIGSWGIGSWTPAAGKIQADQRYRIAIGVGGPNGESDYQSATRTSFWGPRTAVFGAASNDWATSVIGNPTLGTSTWVGNWIDMGVASAEVYTRTVQAATLSRAGTTVNCYLATETYADGTIWKQWMARSVNGGIFIIQEQDGPYAKPIPRTERMLPASVTVGAVFDNNSGDAAMKVVSLTATAPLASWAGNAIQVSNGAGDRGYYLVPGRGFVQWGATKTAFESGNDNTDRGYMLDPANPSIISSQTVFAIAGQPLNYQILTTGTPTQYTVGPLPIGIALNAQTGVISGTTSTTGTWGTTISATVDGKTVVSDFTLVIHAAVVGPVVTITASKPSANEDQQIAGEFTITLSQAAPAGGLTVNYQVGGSAAAGIDYPILPGAVTIPGGLTSATIGVLPINDANPEEAETIVLNLLPGAGYAPAVQSMATVTIARSDINYWVFWLNHRTVNSQELGTGQAHLVWWMTTAKEIKSAVFRIPGRGDFPGEVGNNGYEVEIDRRAAFGDEELTVEDLRKLLPSTNGVGDFGYQCIISYADGTTETRRGSLVWPASLTTAGFPAAAQTSTPLHLGAGTLDAGKLVVSWTNGPINWLSLEPTNGRDLGSRDYFETPNLGNLAPDGNGVRTYTVPIQVIPGQEYVLTLMRGVFGGGSANDIAGSSDEPNNTGAKYAVGYATTNNLLIRPGALPVAAGFAATSDDFTGTLLGAINNQTGLTGTIDRAGTKKTYTATVSRVQIAPPGTNTPVNGVKFLTTYGDGSWESFVLAKDLLGDIRQVDDSWALAGRQPVTRGEFGLYLPSDANQAWFNGWPRANLIAASEPSPQGFPGCVHLRFEFPWDATRRIDVWFAPGLGPVAKVDAMGAPVTTWLIDPPESESDRLTRLFVTRFYQQCLNREPDAGGLAAWTGDLKRKAQAGADVARGFVLSQEFRNRNLNNNDFVDILYRAFFGREPDAGGKAVWLGELAKGVQREDVLYGFILAQEFTNLSNSSQITPISTGGNQRYQVRQFVRRFYQQCLSREPDEGGINNWIQVLVDGTKTGSDVASGFVLSQEFKNRNTDNGVFLDILYKAYFDRAADEGGKGNWLNFLGTGATREQVLAGFSGAQEFINVCGRYGILPFKSNG